VQGFGSSPTQISKFLGFGDTYGLTVPGTDQLCTRELRHIQEDVKLHILLGGGLNPGGSWPFGAGVWKFPMGISKFLAGKPTLEGNDASHRQGRDMGVGAS
jgi:hypothetical protein